MMRLVTTRNILILVIIPLVVWGGVRALRNSRFLDKDATIERIPDNVDLTLQNIKYTKTSGGEPLWTLVADSAAHSKEDSITRIKDVRMVFYDQEAGDIELTAEHGELMPEYRTVTVRTNVKVTNSQGNTLQTDYLEYKEAGNILQTDRMVTIHMGQFMVKGKGMQVDLETRTLVLLSDVEAQFDGTDSH
jgi:LPS export ABC transporter protein LptC